MATEELINSYLRRKRVERDGFIRAKIKYNVAGENIVECDDAIFTGGKYKGMKASDVFVFDVSYLNYLLKNEHVSDELKSILKTIIKNQSLGEDEVKRKLALGD